LLVTSVGTFAIYLGNSSDDEVQQTGNMLGLVSACSELLLGLVAVLVEVRRRRRAAELGEGRLGPVTRFLARVVGQAVTDEVRRRGLSFPLPLQLRWRPTAGPSAGGTGPLRPGQLQDGNLVQLAASTLVNGFRELPSQRLLIVGEPGSGKSTLVLLFTLASSPRPTSRRRRTNDDAAVVPVLLSMAGWRPHEESLRDFVVARVALEYPALAAADLPENALGSLFDDGWILPVLDGLDEMPATLIPPRLGASMTSAGPRRWSSPAAAPTTRPRPDPRSHSRWPRSSRSKRCGRMTRSDTSPGSRRPAGGHR
jgi:hypothetical protein